MGEDAWNFVGHHVGSDELDLIKTTLGQHARLSREELAATVCELLGWTRATGRLKARECREFLERLERAGVVTLPAKRIGRPVGARTAVPVTVRGDIHAAVTGTAHDVAPLRIVRLTTADEMAGSCAEYETGPAPSWTRHRRRSRRGHSTGSPSICCAHCSNRRGLTRRCGWPGAASSFSTDPMRHQAASSAT